MKLKGVPQTYVLKKKQIFTAQLCLVVCADMQFDCAVTPRQRHEKVRRKEAGKLEIAI